MVLPDSPVSSLILPLIISLIKFLAISLSVSFFPPAPTNAFAFLIYSPINGVRPVTFPV